VFLSFSSLFFFVLILRFPFFCFLFFFRSCFPAPPVSVFSAGEVTSLGSLGEYRRIFFFLSPSLCFASCRVFGIGVVCLTLIAVITDISSLFCVCSFATPASLLPSQAYHVEGLKNQKGEGEQLGDPPATILFSLRVRARVFFTAVLAINRRTKNNKKRACHVAFLKEHHRSRVAPSVPPPPPPPQQQQPWVPLSVLASTS
jgi:hypothetical protein